MQGLIIENKANLYTIQSDKRYTATARGKFKNENIQPVVGDIVEFEIIDEENAVIEQIMPRKKYIKRPKMSNLTQIILVISCKHPKPDTLLLDKQLAYAEYMQIKPIIVLNKIDLDEKNEFEQIEKTYSAIGYKVIKTNAKEKIGIAELEKALKNNINVFSGNSGVRKVNIN